MAKHREYKPQSSIHTTTTAPAIKLRTSEVQGYYQPELVLPIPTIKKDIIRSLVVMLVLIGVQIALHVYLQNGGWNKVLVMMKNVGV